MAGVVSLSAASWPSPSSHRPRSRRTPSAAIRLSLVPVGTVAPAASRACVVNAARLHSHDEAGTCSTASPTTRRRVCRYRPTRLASASQHRSLPATPGRERLAPLSGQPQPVVRRSTAFVDQLPFDQRQPQLPPREARHPAAPATAPPRARRRPPPSSARTAPAALAAADPDSRSSPSSRRPSAAPTRRSTAAASPRPCRARRRAPRPRSAPSTRPPRTSACRSLPCISCPGREQRVVDPALEQDCPLYVFRPNLVMSRCLPARVLLPVQVLSRSFRRILLAGLQDAFQSGEWPLCCLAATAYRISTPSGETRPRPGKLTDDSTVKVALVQGF